MRVLFICSILFAVAAFLAVSAPHIIMAAEAGKDFLQGKTDPSVMGISIADYNRYLKYGAIAGSIWTVYAVIFAVLGILL